MSRRGPIPAEAVALLEHRPLRLRQWDRNGDTIKIRLTRAPKVEESRALLAAASAYVQALADPGYGERLARTQLQASALLEALKRIAAFDDPVAGERLAATGSYGSFDEPGAVRIAREAIAAVEAGGR